MAFSIPVLTKLLTGNTTVDRIQDHLLAKLNPALKVLFGTLSGDLVGTLPSPTLATTGVTAGAYGDSTHYATFTVNAKGQLTVAGQQALPSSGAVAVWAAALTNGTNGGLTSQTGRVSGSHSNGVGDLNIIFNTSITGLTLYAAVSMNTGVTPAVCTYEFVPSGANSPAIRVRVFDMTGAAAALGPVSVLVFN